MKNLKSIFALALVSGLFVFSSCEKEDETPVDPGTPELYSIAGFASQDENFSILVEALAKTDLVNTLSGEGNFTVFAPDNNAFKSLFMKLGVSGVQDIPSETLKPILLYHVLGSKVMSGDISTGYVNTLYTSIDNQPVSLYVKAEGSVMLNGSANVRAADVEASNGVIHVIDAVLVPTSVVDIAINNENFTQLVQAVVKAGLVETLSAEGPFTIFAPTDDAFAQLYADLGVSGLDEISAETLIPILQYHVVAGNVLSSQLSDGDVATLNGMISISLSGAVKINDKSEVLAADIQGSNGVIHVIDKVLLP